MKKHVLVFSRLAEPYLQHLSARYYVSQLNPKEDITKQLDEFLPSVNGLIGAGRLIDRSWIERAPNLQVVSSVSVGYDNYDVQALSNAGVLLANTPGVLTESTADLAFALLLASARRVAELSAWTKAGNWQRTIGPEQFGGDVHGKTLGIIGMGAIGSAIAQRGRWGFGMNILYSSFSAKPEAEQRFDAKHVSQEQLLQDSDFVCLAVPLNASTENLVGADELALMKPSAHLINISRGAVVDEPALIEALKIGQIKGAGLDVYQKEPLQTSPLFELPNVVTMPHAGSATGETRHAMAMLALENLDLALAGETPKACVNLASWTRK